MNDIGPPLEHAARIAARWSVGIAWTFRKNCSCRACHTSMLQLLADSGGLLRAQRSEGEARPS
jgi:hypothetical protein